MNAELQNSTLLIMIIYIMKTTKAKRRSGTGGYIGQLTSCQICGNKKLLPVIDLGPQPPCDRLVTSEEQYESEYFFPMFIVRCADCGLVQAGYIAPPEIVFPPEYPYRAGITKMLVDNFNELATKSIAELKLKKGDLVVDVGSNDGTALLAFKRHGMRVVGVEPTNVANIAIKDGVPTIQKFFTKDVGGLIVKKYGKAKLVIATNVFAHINNLSSFVKGVATILVNHGAFISESQYLYDTIEKNQYDTMYHEHLRFYSLKPLAALFRKAGFTLTDAERIASAGGSIRVIAIKGAQLPTSARLAFLLKAEEDFGLYKQETYDAFRNRVEKSRLELTKLLADLRLRGMSVAGVGCPGRGMPILSYCHIDPLLVSYLGEQPGSLKIGLHTPGTHIPVVDEKRLFEEQPEYALLLAWHIADGVIKKLRARGLKSKFIIPLPTVRIVE